jgi:hypothetical protein
VAFDVRVRWLGSPLQLQLVDLRIASSWFLAFLLSQRSRYNTSSTRIQRTSQSFQTLSKMLDVARQRMVSLETLQLLGWSLTLFQRSAQFKQPKPAMSLLSKIGKIFGHSHKASPKQNVNPTVTTPAAAATSGNTGGISKQISFESTSSYATSVPSTISSSPSQARVSLLDACRHGPLQAIPSTECLSEIQEIDEKSAGESSLDAVPPATTGEEASIVPIVLDDHSASCTSNTSETAAADAASEIPVDTEHLNSGAQPSIEATGPSGSESTTAPVQAEAKPSLDWGVYSWKEIFSSDSASLSLCDIAQGSSEEQTSTKESDVTTAATPPSADNVLFYYRPMPWLSLGEVSLWLMSNPDKDISAYVPTTRLQYSAHDDQDCFVDEAVNSSDDDDVESLYAPRESPDVQEQAAPEDPSIAPVLEDALLHCRGLQVERNDRPSTTVTGGDELGTVAHNTSIGDVASEGHAVASADPSTTEDTPAAPQSSLTWQTPSSWNAVSSSDSTSSSSLCDVVQDPIDEHSSMDNSDTDSIESMYRPRDEPVYYYPVEPAGSFGEAASFLFPDASNSRGSGTSSLDLSHDTAEDDDLPSGIQERPASPNPSRAEWSAPSWTGVFSSDSSSSSLCDLAQGNGEGAGSNEDSEIRTADTSISVDAYHATPLTASPAIQVTVEDDEDDEDPFSEKQIRIPNHQPSEQQQAPISGNPFIAHVYENAAPYNRYRPDMDYRAAFLADFLSFPTIVEEDEEEAPVAHLRASPSHDSLLAVDSYPWEYEQVCTSCLMLTVGACANPIAVLHAC